MWSAPKLFIQKTQLAAKNPIIYIDGGWQTLVEGLRQKAVAAGRTHRLHMCWLMSIQRQADRCDWGHFKRWQHPILQSDCDRRHRPRQDACQTGSIEAAYPVFNAYS